MLYEAQGISRFIVVCGYTDLRKGIQGLSQLIEGRFRMYPFEEKTLFLFCGKKGDRIKALLWEGLSEDFCYPHIFQIIAVSSRKPSGKCADKSFYLRPQSLAISFSSSGHSFSSFLEITRPSPCSITAFFCSREGKA